MAEAGGTKTIWEEFTEAIREARQRGDPGGAFGIAFLGVGIPVLLLGCLASVLLLCWIGLKSWWGSSPTSLIGVIGGVIFMGGLTMFFFHAGKPEAQ